MCYLWGFKPAWSRITVWPLSPSLQCLKAWSGVYCSQTCWQVLRRENPNLGENTERWVNVKISYRLCYSAHIHKVSIMLKSKCENLSATARKKKLKQIIYINTRNWSKGLGRDSGREEGDVWCLIFQNKWNPHSLHPAYRHWSKNTKQYRLFVVPQFTGKAKLHLYHNIWNVDQPCSEISRGVLECPGGLWVLEQSDGVIDSCVLQESFN